MVTVYLYKFFDKLILAYFSHFACDKLPIMVTALGLDNHILIRINISFTKNFINTTVIDLFLFHNVTQNKTLMFVNIGFPRFSYGSVIKEMIMPMHQPNINNDDDIDAYFVLHSYIAYFPYSLIVK